jgi:glycine cleavage system regulatory protein
MRDSLVLTVIGPDRTGLVEALAERISAAGGNWEASRMAQLSGQFAGILLVTVDRARTD